MDDNVRPLGGDYPDRAERAVAEPPWSIVVIWLGFFTLCGWVAWLLWG